MPRFRTRRFRTRLTIEFDLQEDEATQITRSLIFYQVPGVKVLLLTPVDLDEEEKHGT